MKQQRLIVTSGLPGSGKSTVAEGIANRLHVPILSVDPIEAAMWAAGLPKEDTGIAAYRVARAVAAENLKQGLTVIIDAVNPVVAAREMWRSLSRQSGVPLSLIEVCCGDEQVHQTRIERRVRDIPGMPEVTWQDVQNRLAEFEAWSEQRLSLDSSFKASEDLIDQAIAYLCA